eukprot:scaffold103385_cov66-Phaeocystis_antarctica.AAC.3
MSGRPRAPPAEPPDDDRLNALPLELQLHVANAVGERCDRAALALASPRLLGLAACRQLPSYQGLEMRLAMQNAIDEQLLRRYARRSKATPEGCKRRAGVADLQISCSGRSGWRWSRWSGVPSKPLAAYWNHRLGHWVAATTRPQIRVTVSGTGQRWYLISASSSTEPFSRLAGEHAQAVSDCTVGALLRHGEPHASTVHHYNGGEGAERLVRNEEPDGRVGHYEGESGAERLVRVETPDGGADHYEGEGGAERLVRAWNPAPAVRGERGRRGPGEMVHCEGEQGAERYVRVEQSCSNRVLHFEGEAGVERQVRQEWPDGGVHHYEGEQGAEKLVRREQPDTLGLAFVQHFDGERKRGAAVRLLRLELPYGGVIHFEGETGAEIDVSVRMN